MKTDNSGSIGIIGGADGPTSIFIAGNPIIAIATIILIMLLIIGVIYLLFKKKSQK